MSVTMISRLVPDSTVRTEASLIPKTERITIPHRYLSVRRWLEVFLIIALFPLVVSVCLVIAILISFESKGGVLFVQRRPGKNGIFFRMYKFRTMYSNSSEEKLAMEADDRITGLGRFLRKYRLDELPQLWNVLSGEMSIIGPRPVPYNFYNVYLKEVPGYKLRHLIKPGITGLAQVLQGYTRTVDEERMKFTYDLYYINNISFKMDLSIMRRTVLHIVKGKS
ncbi:MAG TPA: sugar transferase [Chitinophagaceae bacterium]